MSDEKGKMYYLELQGQPPKTVECEPIEIIQKHDIEKQGYIKVPDDIVVRANALVQYVPHEIMERIGEGIIDRSVDKLADNAYKVIMKEGTHLSKSHNTKGTYRGLLFSNKSNKLEAHAEWVPVTYEKDPRLDLIQASLSAFNIMSAVTGQYFIAEINGKLSNIKHSVDKVYRFLESKERAKVRADEETLMSIFENMQFIISNDVERLSTSYEVKRIKNASLEGMHLFHEMIESEIKSLRINSKYESYKAVTTTLQEYFPQYWCALRNYINSTLLEILLSGIKDKEYLSNVSTEMHKQIEKYDSLIKLCEKKIKEYIENASELNRKRYKPSRKSYVATNPAMNKDRADATTMIVELGIKLGIELIGFGVEAYSAHKKNKAEEDKEGFINMLQNYRAMDETVALVEEYSRLNNSEVELLLIEDEAYYKYIDSE